MITSDPHKSTAGGHHLPLFTRPQVAEALGVKPFTITRWEGEAPPLPIAQPGAARKATLYALPAVIAWWHARELAKLGGDGHGGGGTLSKDLEQAKQAAANTERIKLDIRRRRGQLFDAEEAMRAWAAMVTAFRAQALALPRAMTATVLHVAPEGAQAVERVIDTAIRDCLTTLAGWRPELKDEALEERAGGP